MSDLDSILDAALDEFDASSAPAAAAATASPASPNTAQSPATTNASTSTPSPPTDIAAAAAASLAATPSDNNNLTADPASIAAFQAFLQAMSQSDVGQQMLASQAASSGENLEDMQKELNDMLSQMTEAAKLQSAASSTPNAAAAAASAAASNAVAAAPAAATPASAAATSAAADPFNDAIRMIAEGARSMPSGGAAGGMPDLGGDAQMEALLSKLMAEMGGMGGAGMPGAGGSGDGDFDGASMDAMVEKMMGSMLSKEYLYQPMKDIADRYPEYLQTHASEISEADMVNYRKQQDCFQRIVAAFETEPQSSLKIMELMNEMQSYGTPPKELVANFTPPGFDPNQPLPPGMAGLAGLGAAGGAAGSSPAFPGLPNLGGDPNAPPTAAEMEAFKKMSDDACKQQ